MRDYELALVIDSDVSGEDRKKQITKIQKTIEALKGRVNKTDEWGRKKLVYPIKKKDSGYYFLLAVQLPEASAFELDKKLRPEEKILRYLLVKKE